MAMRIIVRLAVEPLRGAQVNGLWAAGRCEFRFVGPPFGRKNFVGSWFPGGGRSGASGVCPRVLRVGGRIFRTEPFFPGADGRPGPAGRKPKPAQNGAGALRSCGERSRGGICARGSAVCGIVVSGRLTGYENVKKKKTGFVGRGSANGRAGLRGGRGGGGRGRPRRRAQGALTGAREAIRARRMGSREIGGRRRRSAGRRR